MHKLVAIVKRPDDSIYTQEIEYRTTVKQSIKYFQNEMLGCPYTYYKTKTGKLQKRRKKNAYIVIDYCIMR